MDNLFEILVPIIFAAIYFLGNMFSKKSDDEAAPNPRRTSEGDTDAIERQRRIQEEIRRKIMERRREADGGAMAPRTSSAPSQSSDGQRRATREQQKETHQAESSAHKRQPRETHPPQPRETHPQPEAGFSWDESDNAYEQEMQAKLQQIEATKRRAAQLKKQAGTSAKRSERHPSTSRRPALSLFKGPVRSTLRDPAAARVAFIYSEVLGQPISQRKHQTVPGLVR